MIDLSLSGDLNFGLGESAIVSLKRVGWGKKVRER
jgi:hypothetical protein